MKRNGRRTWHARQAELAKTQQAKQLLRSESLLYNLQFREAYQHFQNQDLVGCRLALDECRWDLRGLEYGYLAKVLRNMAPRTLHGHSDHVRALALSADGKRLVSGSADKTIKVWDLATGIQTLTLRGHASAVTSLALSGDGQRLFSGSFDQDHQIVEPADRYGRLQPARPHPPCHLPGAVGRRQGAWSPPAMTELSRCGTSRPPRKSSR